jgi:nicotinate phosphoribosyltransferase
MHLWPDDRNLALFTDLYELSMMQAYQAEGMAGEAVFSLFFRRLPRQRNFILACGLGDVLDYLEALSFGPDSLAYLDSLGKFSPAFLDSLAAFRFTGEVHAVAEGTPVFANEPLLEVVAPLPQAQLVETLVMNQIHLASILASKAARVVAAAEGRVVVDFGSRRMHGIDAALKAARAFHVAGLQATSNLLAGWAYGLPVTGTMAHSFVQAFEREGEAFRAFARQFPETILLVDTYGTLAGVERVIALAGELGEAFRVVGVRLDSGDLGALALAARQRLDEAGLGEVQIFASGGLDEYEIARLVGVGAPIDGFGIGTALGVSQDAPSLDIAYKLCAYEGRGRLKLSAGKPILPGRKQVFRQEAEGQALGDVIGRAEEALPGRPLLGCVMRDGKRLAPAEPLDAARARAVAEIAALPAAYRGLAPAEPGYPVAISERLTRYQAQIKREILAVH